MSDFKEKLKMFQINNTSPPPMKPKPIRSGSESLVKNSPITMKTESKETLPTDDDSKVDEYVKIEAQKGKESVTVHECLKKDTFEDDGLKVEMCFTSDVNERARPSHGSQSSEENTEDDSYHLFDSLYDLPGLEHFICDGYTPKELCETGQSLVDNTSLFPETCEPNSVLEEHPSLSQDPSLNEPLDIQNPINQFQNVPPQSRCNIELQDNNNVTDRIALAPSPKLIEEIFNTSLWRDSTNFSDDFIFAPRSSIDSSLVSTPSIDDSKKAQQGGRRSLFSSIFRSKRGQKKSSEKLPDNLDANNQRESIDKGKPQNKKRIDEDEKSLENTPKKPLNAILNRDWLNTIGDGIKKKASVMSELRKVFNHGKFKHFKKKAAKNTYDVNPETNLYIDDEIYDCEVDDSSENDSGHDATSKNVNIEIKSNFVNDRYTQKSKEVVKESIYDDEGEEEMVSCEIEEIQKDDTKTEESNVCLRKPNDVLDVEDINKENTKKDRISELTSGIESTYDNENENYDHGRHKLTNKKVKTKEKQIKSHLKENTVEGNKGVFTNIFGMKKSKQNDKELNRNKKEVGFNKKNQLNDEKGICDKVNKNETKVISQKNKEEKETYNDEEENCELDLENIKDMNILNENKNNHYPKMIEKRTVVNTKSAKNVKVKDILMSKFSNELLEIYNDDEEVIEENTSDLSEKETQNKEDRTTFPTNEPIEKNSNHAERKNANQKNNALPKSIFKQYSMYDDDEYEEEMKGNKSDPKPIRNVDENRKTKNEIVKLKNTDKVKDISKDCVEVKNKRPVDKLSKTYEVYDDDVDIAEGRIKKELINKGSKKEDDKKNMEEMKRILKMSLGLPSIIKSEKVSMSATKDVDVYDEDDVSDRSIYDEEDDEEEEEYEMEIQNEKFHIEEYASDENDSDDDENMNVNKDNSRTQVNDIAKSKSSFLSMLNAGIKRRQRNMIINIKNSTFISKKTEKKKVNKIRTTQIVEEIPPESFESEEEVLKRIVKKNTEIAKRIFKLKDPIQTIATARAIKTVCVESNTYIQLNIGEFLDVLEYRNDLVLVRNSVGKCGLTSSTNIQMDQNIHL